MIVFCVLVILVSIPIALMPSGPPGRKLLPAAQAKQKYADLIKQKTKLEDETDRVKPEVEKLVYKDTTDALVPKLIRTLQGIAKQSGVHLREIKPLRPKRVASVTKVPMTVRFSTSDFSHAGVGFLYRTEDPAARIVVEKLSVIVSDPKARSVDVEVQVAGFTQAAPVSDKG